MCPNEITLQLPLKFNSVLMNVTIMQEEMVFKNLPTSTVSLSIVIINAAWFRGDSVKGKRQCRN